MAQLARVPPGRAGRMWLGRRLATAERGRDQLDHKLRILVPEQQRLRARAQVCRDEWDNCCAQARTWELRAVLLGGTDALTNSAPQQRSRAEIEWATAVGVHYPSDGRLVQASTERPVLAGNAAIDPARAAFALALGAGIRLAVADEAVRRLDAEVAVTRRRLRALDKRWLPWLRSELASLELSLEQAEQEDGTRLRRAAGPRTTPGPDAAGE